MVILAPLQVGDQLTARRHTASNTSRYCLLIVIVLGATSSLTTAGAAVAQAFRRLGGLRLSRRSTKTVTFVSLHIVLAITAMAPRATLDAWGALVLSAFMTVTVATSLRLHPAVGLGCVVAATSCQGTDRGSVGADPPPRFPLGGWVARRLSSSPTQCLAPLQVFELGRAQWRVLKLPF
jgi:hypothetical protein